MDPSITASALEARPSRTVLILDDVQVNQEVLAEALLSRCAPLRIERANSVHQARTLLQRHPFDLIFFDLYLPDGRGDALLMELRAHTDWRASTALAIAVTADTDPDCARGLLAAGFIEVLVKPWRLSVIEQIADRYLGLICDSTLFDRAQSLRSVGGHIALLPKLRALFYAELRHSLPELEQSMRVGDTERMEQFRHRLAGAAAFAGASVLSDALAQLKQSQEASALQSVRHAAQELLAQAG